MKPDQMTLSLVWNLVRGLMASVLAAGLGTQLAAADPAAPRAPADAGWPCFMDPNHNGVVEGGPKLLRSWPAKGPKLLWASGPLPGKHSGNGSPIVYDGRVYTYADLELPRAGTRPFTKELHEKLTALYAKSADKGKRILVGGDGLTALKVGTKGGGMKPGVIWTSDVPPPQVASPAGDDGRCYLISDGRLVCIDATGKEKWHLELEGEFYASPVLAHDRVYTINRKGRLFVVSTAGRKLDEVQLDSGVEATPAIVQRCIYIRTDGGLLCLGPAKP